MKFPFTEHLELKQLLEKKTIYRVINNSIRMHCAVHETNQIEEVRLCKCVCIHKENNTRDLEILQWKRWIGKNFNVYFSFFFLSLWKKENKPHYCSLNKQRGVLIGRQLELEESRFHSRSTLPRRYTQVKKTRT